MHTCTLPSDSIATVDAYDRRLYTYFVWEDIKRKKEKADLKKITSQEYTLDWSQSKVFLVLLCNHARPRAGPIRQAGRRLVRSLLTLRVFVVDVMDLPTGNRNEDDS